MWSQARRAGGPVKS
uniref:Uncharacterized protein n=1 Tax=Anguilla anguilla TaxID=7936 RepID=A0A0E9Q2S6_ANGAN